MADFRNNPIYQGVMQQGVAWGLSRLAKWNRDKVEEWQDGTMKTVFKAANGVVDTLATQMRYEAAAAQQDAVRQATRGLGSLGNGLQQTINRGAFWELAVAAERAGDFHAAADYYSLAAQHGDQRAIDYILEAQRIAAPNTQPQLTTAAPPQPTPQPQAEPVFTPDQCFQRAMAFHEAGQAEQAVHWWHKAGAVRKGWAFFNLAVSYSNGEGCPVDHAKMAQFIISAAEAGHGEALATVGRFALTGDGGYPVNYSEAYDALFKAAEAEGFRLRGQACHDLATMYRDGLGRNANPAAALVWFERAVEFGYEQAKAEIDKMSTRAAPEPAPANSDKNPHQSGSKQWALWELGLSDGATRADIVLRWRKLMRAGVHPDTGGDEDFTKDLNRAKDVLLKD